MKDDLCFSRGSSYHMKVGFSTEGAYKVTKGNMELKKLKGLCNSHGRDFCDMERDSCRTEMGLVLV